MLEFDVLILPLNDDLQNQLKAKAEEGWILVPGTIPRGIYQICRRSSSKLRPKRRCLALASSVWMSPKFGSSTKTATASSATEPI